MCLILKGLCKKLVSFHSSHTAELLQESCFSPSHLKSTKHVYPLPVWRKLRGEVGHALDKCFSIWQRNHTTQVAGTIHALHVQRWVAVQPDYCLPATVFVNNTGRHCWYPHSTHVILLSLLLWVKALKPPVRSHLSALNTDRHFQMCGTVISGCLVQLRHHWIPPL